MFSLRICAVLGMMCFFSVGNAYAACSAPAGVAGTMEYFGNPDNTYKFCNGTVWVDMGAGGGGGGTLSGLSDVNITNPQDGQPLVYDNASSKWVNAACDDVPNSVAFTDLFDQALSTQVTSNIIQITAIGCSVDGTISGDGTPEMRVCDNATCSTVDHNWTSATVPVDPDQYIQARLTSSGSQAVTHTATVTVGASSDGWDVKTIGPKTVFATSATYTGDLGGLSGADSKCQTLADAAGLGGSYKAWLSDSTDTATARLSHATVNYVLPTGTVVANGWSDLTDGSIDNKIDRDENGNSVSGTAWTDTSPNGTLENASWDCQEWTTGSGAVTGHHGSLSWADYEWTSSDFNPCSGTRRLYCFEQ